MKQFRFGILQLLNRTSITSSEEGVGDLKLWWVHDGREKPSSSKQEVLMTQEILG